MKHSAMLTIASLLSILLIAVHMSEDIARGFSPGGLTNITVVVVLSLWLYATLVLPERRWGLVILLLLSIVGSGIPVIHMMRAGLVGGRIAGSGGVIFWVFSNLALGVTSLFSVILAVRGLWNLQWIKSRD